MTTTPVYDRAWKSIDAALKKLLGTQAKQMRRAGMSDEEILLESTRTLSVACVDMARTALVLVSDEEPTADELRAFLNAAVDLYTRERLSN